jgi:hypothetical protein
MPKELAGLTFLAVNNIWLDVVSQQHDKRAAGPRCAAKQALFN